MYDKYLNKLESLLDTKLEKTEKVELGVVDELLSYAKKGGKKFDELAKLNNFADKIERSLRKEQQEIEQKLKETEKAKVLAKNLGVDIATNQLKDVEVLLKKSLSDINKVIKIAQAAQRSSI